MGFLLLLFVFMFVSPLIRYVSYYSPFLGMLCYGLIILAFVTYSSRRRRAFQQGFYGNASNNNNAQYQQTQQSQSSEPKQESKRSSDVIDVEYSEEEVH